MVMGRIRYELIVKHTIDVVKIDSGGSSRSDPLQKISRNGPSSAILLLASHHDFLLFSLLPVPTHPEQKKEEDMVSHEAAGYIGFKSHKSLFRLFSLSLPSAIKHSGGRSGISPLNDSYVDDPLLLSPY